MTQQWGNPWPPPGRSGGQGQGFGAPPGGEQPGSGPSGFGRPGFGQPGFGHQYGQRRAAWPGDGGQPAWPPTQRPGWQGGAPYAEHPAYGQPAPYGQPTPYGQPGQPPGPWGPPPPAVAPPRRGGLGRLILLGLGCVLLVFVGLAVISALSKPAYQNESYRVPAANPSPGGLPFPESVQEANELLTNNSLYRQKVANPVRCDMGDLDARTASDPELKRHFEDQAACLMRVWDPTVSATREFKLYRPTVTIYGTEINTPCGREKGINAFYCGANQQLYYSRELARTNDLAAAQQPRMVELILAHEFGHLVQGRVGIVPSRAYKIEEEHLPVSEQLWLSRRSETQADCFAGMWLRSTAQSRRTSQTDIENFYRTLEAIGDDSLGAPAGKGNHGLAATRRYWGQMGMSTDDVGKCNTWAAPQELVR